MAPAVGFEPTTLRLTAECSTVELLRNTYGGRGRNRTDVRGFAIRCMTTLPLGLHAFSPRHLEACRFKLLKA